jgi:hypothetical protein
MRPLENALFMGEETEGWDEKVLDLPARSRFGEGRADTFET